MRFKEAGVATERMVRSAVQISIVFWCTVPVFAIMTNVYRRTPIVPAYAIPGYLAGISLAVLGGYILMLSQRNEWAKVKPWMVLLMITLLTVIVVETNLSAAGSEATVYRVLFTLPIVLVATIGGRTMMIIVLLENFAGLAYVTWEATNDLDTVVAALFTYGTVWIAICVAVHLVMMRFVRSMRSAESMSHLAAVAADIDEWPPDPETCVQWIAGALVADRAAVYARQPGEVWSELAHWPDDRDVVVPPGEDVELTIDKHTGIVVPVEAATGQELVIIASASEMNPDEMEGIARTVGRLVSGMAERFTLVSKLRIEARVDPLTGIANRRGLFERFEVALDVARRSAGTTEAEQVAVAIMDVDHFKRFNDTYGHLEGDALLKRLGQSLGLAARTKDLPARYGGEEFCLLMPGGSIADAAIVLGRVRSDLERAAPDGTQVTFSCGVAVWDGTESAEALLDRADGALYVAKESGRDQMRAIAAGTKDPVAVPLVRFEPTPA